MTHHEGEPLVFAARAVAGDLVRRGVAERGREQEACVLACLLAHGALFAPETRGRRRLA